MESHKLWLVKAESDPSSTLQFFDTTFGEKLSAAK